MAPLANEQFTEPATTVSKPDRELMFAISRALEEEVAKGDALRESMRLSSPLPVSVFDGLAVPTMPVAAYLERLCVYMNCSVESFLISLPILARLLWPNPADTSTPNPHRTVHLHSNSAHRLIGTAVVIAAKFHDDAYRTNAYYASVVGVPLRELNRLEMSFLNAVSFGVVVHADEYERWRARLAWAVVDSALQVSAPALQVSATTLQVSGTTLQVGAAAVQVSASYPMSPAAGPADALCMSCSEDRVHSVSECLIPSAGG